MEFILVFELMFYQGYERRSLGRSLLVQQGRAGFELTDRTLSQIKLLELLLRLELDKWDGEPGLRASDRGLTVPFFFASSVATSARSSSSLYGFRQRSACLE